MISHVVYLFMFIATMTFFSYIPDDDSSEKEDKLNSKNNDFEFIDLETGIMHTV